MMGRVSFEELCKADHLEQAEINEGAKSMRGLLDATSGHMNEILKLMIAWEGAFKTPLGQAWAKQQGAILRAHLGLKMKSDFEFCAGLLKRDPSGDGA